MTTIVCNREGMAADKRISGGAMFRSTKLFRVNGSIIGIAGNAEQALRFVEWRRTPEQKPQFNSESSMEALELYPDGRLVYWGAEMVGIPIEEDFYAIGSGSHLALGALTMGASLKEAIKVAAKWDNGTGTQIQTMSL
jgi:20S proteasome alpha/beta subunit